MTAEKVKTSQITDTVESAVWLTSPESLRNGSPLYLISDLPMADHGWLKLKDFTVEVQRPSLEDALPTAIAALRAEQREINRNAAADTARLEARIANLLALEAPRDL